MFLVERDLPMCASVCFSWWAVCGSTARQVGGLMGLAKYMSVCPDKATDVSQTERCFPSLDSRFVLAPAPEALQNTLGQLPGRRYLSRRENWATQADSSPLAMHLGRGQLSVLPWLFFGDQESVRTKGFKRLQFCAFSTSFYT